MNIVKRSTEKSTLQYASWSTALTLILLICIVIGGSTSLVVAQSNRQQQLQGFGSVNDDEQLRTRSPLTQMQPTGVALESTVLPDEYFVGPSDIISVNIWTSPPLNFPLTVSPEGTLIIPTVGEIPVSNMLLSQAKTKIIQLVRKKYLSSEVTATLIKPRSILVNILGSVIHPGQYTVSSVSRASIVVEKANQPVVDREEPPTPERLNKMSLRNIMLRHADGSQQRVDIVKYLSMKDSRWNPYLREGDVIVVPDRDPEKYAFGIYGEVNNPDRYEFVEGDSLIDAIRIGQGLTNRANIDSVVFSHLSLDGETMTKEIISLRNGAVGPAAVLLQPGDRIVVPVRPEQRGDYRVSLSGEIARPGTYPITRNTTRLSDVIRRAGGFTSRASLGLARVSRHSVSPEEIKTERLYSLRGAVTPQDSAQFFIETDVRLNGELVDVDFSRLFVDHDTTQDVLLLNGDVIHIPQIEQTVYVFGQVVSPGHTQLVAGKDAMYYINKSGGLTDRARKGDIRVIKGRSRQWLEPDKTTLEGGDYVWVPTDPDRPFAYYMNIASQSASVLSVIIGITVLIIQARK